MRVVDDQAAVRTVVRLMLEALGRSSSTSACDGIDGARIALSRDTSPERQVAYRAAGFDDVVGKPATLAELRAALQRAGIGR